MQYKKGVFSINIDGNSRDISNFVLIPVKRVKSTDGIHYIELFAIANGEILDTYLVEATEIEKRYYINRFYGGICNIFPYGKGYGYILHALKILLSKTDEVYQFSKIGWHRIEDKPIFVHGSGVINWQKDYVIHESLEKYSILKKDISPEESYVFYMQLLKVASKKIVYPLICHTLCGVLFSLFKEVDREIDFVLFLCGKSGSMKTTLSFLIGNIYNKGKSFKHSSFESTANDIEAFLSEIAVVGIADDRRPPTDLRSAQAIDDITQRIIRNTGDGNGRGRLTRDLIRHEKFIPNCAVIMTGEYGINGSSTVARTHSVNMCREDININLLTKLQTDEVNLSTTIHNFIEWIAKNYSEVLKYIDGRFDSLNKEIISKLSIRDMHMRKPKMVTCYIIAFELFMMYGLEIGAITENSANKKIKTARKVLLKSIHEQFEDVHTNDPIHIYFKAIDEMLATNRVILSPIGKESNSQKLIGYEDSKKIYLLPDATFSKVNQFYKAQNRIFPIGAKDLKNSLYEAGIIEVETSSTGQKSKSNKKKTVSKNKRIRVMVVKKSELNKYLYEENKSKSKKKKKWTTIKKLTPEELDKKLKKIRKKKEKKKW